MVYGIRVAAYIPYPIYREYYINASDFSAAVSRAIKTYRKEERVKGKKFDRLTVQAVKGTAKFMGQ